MLFVSLNSIQMMKSSFMMYLEFLVLYLCENLWNENEHNSITLTAAIRVFDMLFTDFSVPNALILALQQLA